MMRVVLLGGGGHASDVLGAIEALNQEAAPGHKEIKVAGLLADDDIDPKRFAHRNVRQIGTLDDLASVDASHFIACVGFPEGRRSVATRATSTDKTPATIIHPRAWVPAGTKVGQGSVILAGVCVSPCADIGNHAYLSHGSLIGHDCEVCDFVSIMPGASVSGDTRLGTGAMIGANATVLQKVQIGSWATLGAGAVANKNIPDKSTAIGIPARVIRKV